MTNTRLPYPLTTIVFGTTAVVTAATLAAPGILLALQRQPTALKGEWWRFVTPLLLERGGWIEISFNLVTLALVGILAERTFGRGLWLVSYLVGGVVGQIAGLAWKPIG